MSRIFQKSEATRTKQKRDARVALLFVATFAALALLGWGLPFLMAGSRQALAKTPTWTIILAFGAALGFFAWIARSSGARLLRLAVILWKRRTGGRPTAQFTGGSFFLNTELTAEAEKIKAPTELEAVAIELEALHDTFAVIPDHLNTMRGRSEKRATMWGTQFLFPTQPSGSNRAPAVGAAEGRRDELVRTMRGRALQRGRYASVEIQQAIQDDPARSNTLTTAVERHADDVLGALDADSIFIEVCVMTSGRSTAPGPKSGPAPDPSSSPQRPTIRPDASRAATV